jgi:hypothetical protein
LAALTKRVFHSGGTAAKKVSGIRQRGPRFFQDVARFPVIETVEAEHNPQACGDGSFFVAELHQPLHVAEEGLERLVE